MKKALLIVDVQNDFTPGGALAVPEGDEIVPLVNRLAQDSFFGLVVATQDWHLADHLSFASQHPGKNIGEVIELGGEPQVLWPDHCVQGTNGAQLCRELDATNLDRIFQKGQKREVDSYSGFYDNDHQTSTGLGEYLKEQEVAEVYVCGLATDYCVKYSAIDANQFGFKTYLIEDAARGVNLTAGDVQNAVDEMRDNGITIVQSSEVVQ